MLFIPMLIMVPGAAANPTIDLVCEVAPLRNGAKFVFVIDENSRTFTGMMDDKNASSGVAEVTDNTITLVNRGTKITYTYRISRTSGDFLLESGLNDRAPVETLRGRCSKYSGRAF